MTEILAKFDSAAIKINVRKERTGIYDGTMKINRWEL